MGVYFYFQESYLFNFIKDTDYGEILKYNVNLTSVNTVNLLDIKKVYENNIFLHWNNYDIQEQFNDILKSYGYHNIGYIDRGANVSTFQLLFPPEYWVVKKNSEKK